MFSSVHSRYRLPAVGDKAWTIPSPGSSLPEGLPEYRRVYILMLHSHSATVGDPSGKEWHLPYANLETVQEYFIEEQWLPESDPRALAHVRKMIKEEGEQPMLAGVGEFAAEWLQRLKWILERNGVRIDGGFRQPSQQLNLELTTPRSSVRAPGRNAPPTREHHLLSSVVPLHT